MSSKIAYTCFLSTDLRTDTSKVREALEEKGVRWTDVAGAPPSISILETIRQAIKRSSFVCALLGFEPVDEANRAFEIGLAHGLGKPIFLIISEDRKVPSGMQDLYYVHAS